MPAPAAARLDIFLSYASGDAFEAGLLQFAAETILKDIDARVWTYHRDQPVNQNAVALSLKAQVQRSAALILLVSPATLKIGATQWMELAYADAYDLPIFVLLHRVSFAALRAPKSSAPPLLLQSQCNQATDWKRVIGQIRTVLAKRPMSGA